MGLRAPELLHLAPEIGERARKDRFTRTDWNKNSWNYGEISGSYRRFFDKETSLESNVEFIKPRGAELVIEDHIATLLSDHTISTPVVHVDFGGVLSLTNMRMVERFLQEIKDGRLCVVVTNLELTSEDIRNGLDAYQTLRESPELRSLFLRNQPYVHYLNGTATDLHTKHIVLPDGRELPLSGNVSSLIEWNTLSFSYKPDVDLPFVADLLAEDGILLSGTKKPIHMNAEDIRLWHIGHQYGLEYLRESGLRELTFNQDDPVYRVFLGPTAYTPLSLLPFVR